MSKPKITIVIPVWNGATTLQQLFDGLEIQHHKDLIDAIYIIDDCSRDKSWDLIQKYAKSSSYTVKTKLNQKGAGLANGYNYGAQNSKTPYLITMHQDMVLIDQDVFPRMLKPFKDPKVVASYPATLMPYNVWNEYNFWQKCLFSRFVGKRVPMLTGKFDCFQLDYLRNIGLFDSKTFRTAGEDSDFKLKVELDGLLIADSGVDAIHLQYTEKNFSFRKLLWKEAQLAEAQGVILRKYGIQNIKDFCLNFFRQILLIGCFIPVVNFLMIPLTLAYAYVYTRLVYKTQKDPRIILLPFVNILLLVVASLASARGFMRTRQII